MSVPELDHFAATEAVRKAVGSLRLMGGLFLVLAALLVWEAVAIGGMRAGLPVERVAAAAVLLAGPGVLYQVTAVRVRRHDVTVAVLARRTAVAQAALPVVVVGVMVISGGARRVPILADALMPATVTLFFVPALLAQAHEIGRALEALRRLPQAQRGFEVQPPVAVLPVDDGDGDGSS